MVMILSLGSVRGQGYSCADTLGLRIHFRTGRSQLEPSFSNNAAVLSDAVKLLRRLKGDSTIVFRQLRLESGSSPEGTNNLNEQLSLKRGNTMRNYFVREVPLADSLIALSSHGVDWDGLIRLVTASQMPYKEEVLDILNNTPEWVFKNNKVVDSRKRQLGMLRGGRAWNYMFKHFFPELRGACISVVCEYDTIPDHSVNIAQASDFSIKANVSADKALAAAARAEREADIAVAAAAETVAAAKETLVGNKKSRLKKRLPFGLRPLGLRLQLKEHRRLPTPRSKLLTKLSQQPLRRATMQRRYLLPLVMCPPTTWQG